MANILYTAYCRTVQLAIKVFMAGIKWPQPTLIKGKGSINQIAPILCHEHKEQIFLMVSGTIMRSGMLTAMLDQFKKENLHYTIFDKVMPNPTDVQVEEAYSIYMKEGAQVIVAIGGGSVIDCAKAVGARAANPKKHILKLMGMKVHADIPLLIAVPTTAGTGTEVTMYAVITDSKAKHKQGMGDPHLIPDYGILDPVLTLSVPRNITAFTAMIVFLRVISGTV